MCAAGEMSDQELLDFLPGWREGLCTELKTNSHGHLPQRQPALSQRITNTFPDIKIIRLYTAPVVSTFDSVDRSDWVSRNVSIGQLTQLCERYFSWGTVHGISKKFVGRVWPGICFRQLLEVCFSAAISLTPLI